MVIGIGVDIVEIPRLEMSLQRSGEIFMNHVYTNQERANVPSNATARLCYLAGRWAAKEAVSKALGTGIGSACTMQDIDIINDDLGQPVIQLSGSAADTAEKKGVKFWHISISHEKGYAVAMVVAEGQQCC